MFQVLQNMIYMFHAGDNKNYNYVNATLFSDKYFALSSKMLAKEIIRPPLLNLYELANGRSNEMACALCGQYLAGCITGPPHEKNPHSMYKEERP